MIARTTAIRCGAGSGDRAGVVWLDPADREERQPRVARGVGDEPVAGGGSVRAGRCRVHGADADVVEREPLGRVDLRGRVRGTAEQPVRADRRARLRDVDRGAVDVHAVGSGCGDQLGAVVEHQRHAVAFADGLQPRRRGEDFSGLLAVVHHLDDVDAAPQGGVEPLLLDLLADQVEPRVLQPLARVLDHGAGVCQEPLDRDGESVESRSTAVLRSSQ